MISFNSTQMLVTAETDGDISFVVYRNRETGKSAFFRVASSYLDALLKAQGQEDGPISCGFSPSEIEPLFWGEDLPRTWPI